MGMFKTFANNQLLTAQEVNDYLMRQALISVDDQAERDLIPAPQPGMRVYREDTKREERWTGTKWLPQPGVETRRFNVTRAAVPTGLAAYYLSMGAEVAAVKTEGAFNVAYSSGGADAGSTLLDAGYYMLSAMIYVDWGYAGAQGAIAFREYGAGNQFAQANYGGNQFVTLNTPWFTDGTKRFMLEGWHNSGSNKNLTGLLDIVRLRGN